MAWYRAHLACGGAPDAAQQFKDLFREQFMLVLLDPEQAIQSLPVLLDGKVRDPMALHMAMLEQVYQRADQFDILHFHLDYFPFSLFSRNATPFITTLHGRLDLPEHQVVFDVFNRTG